MLIKRQKVKLIVVKIVQKMPINTMLNLKTRFERKEEHI